jgi:UDP-2-acetamido-2,6-beta-L-arabino-hexul-4-ose reductase
MKTSKLNIVGNGFLAKKFKKYNAFFKKKNYFIYLAGVSNSNEKKLNNLQKDFNRIKFFIKNIKNSKIIYVSSCSIFDPNRRNSLYLKNKIKIEKLIKDKCDNFLIIRLPEIVGKSKNKNTLTNFFYSKIKTNGNFILYANAKRNLLDINDAIKLVLYFLQSDIKEKFLNISNLKFTNSLEIIKTFERLLKKKANYIISNKKHKPWKINTFINKNILKKNKNISNYSSLI